MKNKILDFFNLIFLPLIFLVGFELYLLRISKIKNISSGNSDCRVFIKDKGFSAYKKNCILDLKHWENEESINYTFNEYGRRDGDNPNKEFSSGKLAVIGGSFPLGAMVSINDNYNYYAFNKTRKKRYIVHNYAAALEGIDNSFNRLKNQNFENYDFIIFGISPNLFFEYLSNDDDLLETESKSKNRKSGLRGIFNNSKNLITSTAISRLIFKKTFNNNNIYYQSYMMRKPYSHYLNPNLDKDWLYALNKFESKLSNLPPNIKEKLKVVYLPQRVEIVSKQLGFESNYLSSLLKEIFLKKDIDFLLPNIDNLAELKNSHFTIDGHLTKEGHHSIGDDLYRWSLGWE